MDRVRVVRALEVAEMTGDPPSARKAGWASGGSRYRVLFLVREIGRETLYRRIDRRVDEMGVGHRGVELGEADECLGVVRWQNAGRLGVVRGAVRDRRVPGRRRAAPAAEVWPRGEARRRFASDRVGDQAARSRVVLMWE